MKANQVSEHFDFIIKMSFIKIACGGGGGTLRFILLGLIGTCQSEPHACTYLYNVNRAKIIFVFSPQ